jgi:hypothetical protein
MLKGLQNPNTLRQSEQYMQNAAEQQTAPFMLALITELGKEEQDVALRQQAGLYFKNMLTGIDDSIRQMKEDRWRDTIDSTTKQQVRRPPISSISNFLRPPSM